MFTARYLTSFPSKSFFPEKAGLVPWGFTDSRTSLFWDSNNRNPEDWSIVILEHGFEPEEFSCSVPEFLIQEIKGVNQSYLLPSNIREDPHFYRYSDHDLEWIDVSNT